jgi:hypothetical protein
MHKYTFEQFESGSHYCNLPTGDLPASLARTAVCFTEALRFRANGSFTELRA